MFDNFILQNTKTGNQVEFNFDEGETPTPSSDVSDSTVTFTETSTRTNILSGETLSVIFGKIKKFFSDLKTVAFTGSYNDLSDTPSLFSGSYNDLTDKPTIPTVNNATLTIKQGENTMGTFTANASSDVTITLAEGGGGSVLPLYDYTFLMGSASDVVALNAGSVSNLTELENYNAAISVSDYGTMWTDLNNILNLTGNVVEAYSEYGMIPAINQTNVYSDSTQTTSYLATWFNLGMANDMLLQVLIVNVSDTIKVYLCNGFGTGGMTYDDINVHIKQLSEVTVVART